LLGNNLIKNNIIMIATAHRAGPAEPVDLDRGDPRGEQGGAGAAGVARHVDGNVELLFASVGDEGAVIECRAEMDVGESPFDPLAHGIGPQVAPEQANGFDPGAVETLDGFDGELPERGVAQFAGEEADVQGAAGGARGVQRRRGGGWRSEGIGHAALEFGIVEHGQHH